ncbi:upf0481 protein [Quercus suber]|uniref:Upf0481 protein n=1 Tax=Quercus suber TaxID=58331 RepID=A0AAW0JIG1_QUESU
MKQPSRSIINANVSSQYFSSEQSTPRFPWNPLANTSKKEPNLLDYCPSYRSLSELKSFFVKKRKSCSVLDIEFLPGFFYSQLKLPTLALGQLSVILWNNLIAFEWSPACNTEAVLTSYICFLSALIANPNDVKELRSKRILLNIGGSDEEVFKFFEELSTSSIEDPSIYRNIREEIEKHCRSKYFRNIYKYFRNPWSALGLFAAIAVVVLSFVQTYFTIYPGKDECMESICSYLKRQQIKNV